MSGAWLAAVASVFFLGQHHEGGAETKVILSFDQAVGLAADTVIVTSAREAVQVRKGLEDRLSSLTANPQLWLQVGPRFKPDEARALEIVGQVLQPFNLSGLAGEHRRAAAVERQALSVAAAVTALARRTDVARAWIDLWNAWRQVELLQAETEVAAAFVSANERAFALGEATAVDVAEANAFMAEVKLALVEAEGLVHNLGLLLGRLLDQAHVGEIETAGPLPHPVVPAETEEDHYMAKAGELPAVRAQRLLARASQARASEERALSGYVLAAGVNVERDAPAGLVVSGVVQLTPPLFAKGLRPRAVAMSDKTRLEGEAEDAAAEARRVVALAFHEVAHSARSLEVITSELLPAERRTAELRRKQFDVGAATVMEVLTASRRALLAQRRIVAARSEHAWTRVKLWLLIASMVTGGASEDPTP